MFKQSTFIKKVMVIIITVIVTVFSYVEISYSNSVQRQPIYNWNKLSQFYKYTNDFSVIARNDEVIDPQLFVAQRIKKFEGFKAKKYKCVVSGVKLQGYGRSVGKQKTPRIISEDKATTWLLEDLVRCTNDLDMYLPWWRSLSNIRQSAMLDLTYNMGISKLMTFKKFLRYMEHGSFNKAAKALTTTGYRKTGYATQVGIRAIEVSTAIKNNTWICLKK